MFKEILHQLDHIRWQVGLHRPARLRAIISQLGSLGNSHYWRQAGLALVALVLFGEVLAVAYHQGGQREQQALLQTIEHNLITQHTAYQMLRKELAHVSTAKMVGVSSRLATLQTHMARLDALGSRLVHIADLEDGEFDFVESPGLGGRAPLITEPTSSDSVLTALDLLEHQVEDRELQLRLLKELVQSRSLAHEARPSGWPVDSGWISSYFGWRKDPFHGRKAFHKGIDFAARTGVTIRAMADGIVEFAGRKKGYGNLVEVYHGDGYLTRYAHAEELLVREGEKVARGTAVAKVGSTGRSTGSHLHFEVVKDGKIVNPLNFVSGKR